MRVLFFGGFLNHTWSPIEQRYLWFQSECEAGSNWSWVVEIDSLKHDITERDKLPIFAQRLDALGADVRYWDVRPRNPIFTFRRIWKILREVGPDVVYTHFGNSKIYLEIAARLQGRIVIRGEHNFAFESFRRGKLLKRIFWRFVPNHFLAISQAVATHLELNGISNRKISIVYNGFDFHKFLSRNKEEDRNSLLCELDLPVDAKLLVCVAKLSRNKGQDILIEMIKCLSRDDIFLLLVGEDVEPDYTKSILEDLESDTRDRVYLLGYRNDAARLMNAADIVYLPSRSEGLGNVVIESLAVKTPVIVANLPALREIVQSGENGLVSELGTGEHYAELTEMLLRSPLYAEDLSKNGRESVINRFGKNVFVSTTLNEIRKVYRMTRDR